MSMIHILLGRYPFAAAAPSLSNTRLVLNRGPLMPLKIAFGWHIAGLEHRRYEYTDPSVLTHRLMLEGAVSLSPSPRIYPCSEARATACLPYPYT